jgi:hypothetical protein
MEYTKKHEVFISYKYTPLPFVSLRALRGSISSLFSHEILLHLCDTNAIKDIPTNVRGYIYAGNKNKRKGDGDG